MALVRNLRAMSQSARLSPSHSSVCCAEVEMFGVGKALQSGVTERCSSARPWRRHVTQ
jgi:hypothetical protein